MGNKKQVEKQVIAFDSILACSDYLEANQDLWQKSRKSGSSFTECMSHKKTRAILADGGHWPEGAERMAKAALDISKVPAGDFEMKRRVNAPIGYRPNVPAYLAGSPLSMRRTVRMPRPNKAVKMLVSVAGSAGVKHGALMNRGAAIMGAIDSLQAEGFAVEVTVGFAAECGMGEFHTTVMIKDFGATWNPAAFAFMLAEPSFFRRSLFAVANIEQARDSDSIAEGLGSSLGTPIKKTNNIEYDIEYESLHSAEGWTPENSADKAMKKVYEWLARNKAGDL